jgi:hypothetical protein
MVYEAFMALMDELDWILDSEDVILTVLVCVVDDGRERRGLSTAGRSGNQDQTALEHGEFLQEGRESQLVRGQYR